MKGIPQGRYTKEFREEAIKLVTEERLSLPEVARQLSLAPSTLSYWIKAYKAGKLGDKIIINNGCLEGKICLPVLSNQFARLYGLVNGMASANVIKYRCPDQGKVVYEIRRDPDHWWQDAVSPLTEAEVKPYVP